MAVNNAHETGAFIATSPVAEPKQLSYKFQRVREKLRKAVASGELSGKLPGERALCKRFHVNAKTLNKALTDLVAEGLLETRTGRGTFVKGHVPAGLQARPWLVLCDSKQSNADIVEPIRATHRDLEMVSDVLRCRPSFLNRFTAVIDMAADTPGAFVRSLLVRGIPVVTVDRAPATYSTHTVRFDAQWAVRELGRVLVEGGHRSLAVVHEQQNFDEGNHSTGVVTGCRVRTIPCDPGLVPAMLEAGITAFICQNVDLARKVRRQLDVVEPAWVPRIALGAIGLSDSEPPCSGYYVSAEEQARAVTQLLSNPPRRPAAVWLAGSFIDRGTLPLRLCDR